MSRTFYLYEIMGISETISDFVKKLETIKAQIVSGVLRYAYLTLLVMREHNKIRKYIIITPIGIFRKRNLKRSRYNFDVLGEILRFRKETRKPKSIKICWLAYIKKKVKVELEDIKSKTDENNLKTVSDTKFESILDALKDYTGIAILIRVKKLPEDKLELNVGLSTFIIDDLSLSSELFKGNQKLNKILHQAIFLMPSILDILDLENVDKILKLAEKKPTIVYLRNVEDDVLIPRKTNIIIRAGDRIIANKVISILKWFFLLGQSSLTEEPKLDIKYEKSEGTIFVGEQIKDGRVIAPFYLSSDDIRRHLVILGASGAGKTRLARAIIEEILKKYPTRIWIFDFHGEYVDLASENNFLIIAPASVYAPLALNIFNPINEKIESYSTFLLNIMIESLRASDQPLSPQMERILSISVFETLKDIEARNPLMFIYNLWKWSKRLNDTLPSAINSFHGIINRIRNFFVGSTASVFWVLESNIDIEYLLSQNVLFDLSFIINKGILKRDLMLLHNVLLRYALSSLVRDRFHLDDYPRIFLVIEEAKYLVPWKRKETALDSSILEDLAVISRKYGLALCTVSQTASSLSRDILENAGTYFFMSGGIDDQTLFEGLDKIFRYIQMLPPRHAIVKLTSLPSLIHIRVRNVTAKHIDPDVYIGILRSNGEILRRNHKIIPIPFETFVSQVMQDKITEDTIYELTSRFMSEACMNNFVQQILSIRIEEKLTEILENAQNKEGVILELLSNSRKLSFILSELPDELIETNDLKSLSRTLTDIIFEKIRLLAGESVFRDRVQMLDAYYTTLELVMKLLCRRKHI